MKKFFFLIILCSNFSMANTDNYSSEFCGQVSKKIVTSIEKMLSPKSTQVFENAESVTNLFARYCQESNLIPPSDGYKFFNFQADIPFSGSNSLGCDISVSYYTVAYEPGACIQSEFSTSFKVYCNIKVEGEKPSAITFGEPSTSMVLCSNDCDCPY